MRVEGLFTFDMAVIERELNQLVESLFYKINDQSKTTPYGTIVMKLSRYFFFLLMTIGLCVSYSSSAATKKNNFKVNTPNDTTIFQKLCSKPIWAISLLN